MVRSSLSRCVLPLLGFLCIGACLASIANAAPRLSISPLDPRYRDGELVETTVFLELDPEFDSFQYVQFGIQSDPGLEVNFFFSPPFRFAEELQTFNHRIWDNQRLFAGTGSRGFSGPAPTIPVVDGRVELGLLQIVPTKLTNNLVETQIVRLGTCQCFDAPDEDAAFVNIDSATRIDLAISDVEVNIGEDTFLRGDGNVDGHLDMSDAILTLIFMVLGDVNPTCLDALDYDDSGNIAMRDAIMNLEYLFLGTADPPAAPFPERGPDPTTTDPLGCNEYEIVGS